MTLRSGKRGLVFYALNPTPQAEMFYQSGENGVKTLQKHRFDNFGDKDSIFLY